MGSIISVRARDGRGGEMEGGREGGREWVNAVYYVPSHQTSGTRPARTKRVMASRTRRATSLRSPPSRRDSAEGDSIRWKTHPGPSMRRRVPGAIGEGWPKSRSWHTVQRPLMPIALYDCLCENKIR